MRLPGPKKRRAAQLASTFDRMAAPPAAVNAGSDACLTRCLRQRGSLYAFYTHAGEWPIPDRLVALGGFAAQSQPALTVRTPH